MSQNTSAQWGIDLGAQSWPFARGFEYRKHGSLPRHRRSLSHHGPRTSHWSQSLIALSALPPARKSETTGIRQSAKFGFNSTARSKCAMASQGKWKLEVITGAIANIPPIPWHEFSQHGRNDVAVPGRGEKYRPAAVANAPCVRRGDAVMGADWAQSILEHVLDPERPHSKAHLRQNAIAVTPSGAILLPACRSTWVIRYHL